MRAPLWAALVAALTLTDPRQVLSIGGRLRPGGRLVPSAPDQFNGAVDEVFLDIG